MIHFSKAGYATRNPSLLQSPSSFAAQRFSSLTALNLLR